MWQDSNRSSELLEKTVARANPCCAERKKDEENFSHEATKKAYEKLLETITHASRAAELASTSWPYHVATSLGAAMMTARSSYLGAEIIKVGYMIAKCNNDPALKRLIDNAHVLMPLMPFMRLFGEEKSLMSLVHLKSELVTARNIGSLAGPLSAYLLGGKHI